MTRLTRRTAIRVGTSVVAATALRLDSGDRAAATSEHERQILSGVIRSIPSGDAIVVETPAGLLRVRFNHDATFNRSGPAVLTSFREGDRVVVELARDSRAHAPTEHVSAMHLEVSYGRLAGSVIAVGTDGVTTTAGQVAVDADTIVHDAHDFTRQRPLSDLREGMAVVILTQFEPSSNRYLARRIGVTGT